MATATDRTASPADQRIGLPSNRTDAQARDGAAPVPLVVGVTGHRDLVAAEISQLRELVREFLKDLEVQFPETPLSIMTSLADGADRLVAHEAVAMNIPLLIALPMPVELYKQDFTDAESVKDFEHLYAQGEVLELPLVEGKMTASMSNPGNERDKQYAQAGVYICAHCHILLALWDGKSSEKLGGTAQVVRFHHDDTMPGFTDSGRSSQQILADDESDLVYHIVCSRDQPDGAPSPSMQALQTSWFTTDNENPRTDTIPERYIRIFERTSEFNADAVANRERIAAEKYSLLSSDSPASLPPSVREIDDMFTMADWLAIRFQKYVNFMLAATYTLAALMGLAFIAYSDLEGQEQMIFAFLLFFAAGVVLYVMSKRGGWHRRYLDYRALAEGLRVQFYWTASGVEAGRHTKFAHDNFLQKQDVELGWIRNVMRVAVLRSDIETAGDTDAGLEFSIREWVGGTDGMGQTCYFKSKAAERAQRNRKTEMLAMASLGGGILVAIVLALFGWQFDDNVRDPLIVAMGVLPLLAAVREAYAHKTAEKELIKQYQFMHRIFFNAKRRLDAAKSSSEKRDILKALGNAALDEHAEWILIHRERPLEHTKLA